MSNVSMIDGHIDENKMTDIKKLTEDLEYARYHCTSSKGKDAINDALDLINRQQAENERLNGVIKNFKATKERQKAEINRLNKAVYNYEACLESIEKIKAKAIKEFAERLKEECAFECDVSLGYGRPCYEDAIPIIAIDNLVKEMAGESYV